VGFVRGGRTVKKLRLSKALTIPDGTTVAEACRMMAVRRVDAVLLTDANDLLSGIVTDKVSCVPSVESLCNFWCLRDYDWLASGSELKRSDPFRLQCHCIVVAALMIVLHLVP
jgi:hypothetical protein